MRLKRVIRGGVFLGFAACLFLGERARGAAVESRPNIVIILADDMGFSDVGCFGGEVQTPNLDHLAAGGVRLTQFYNMARCCPTRASLLTGLYPHQAGMGAMCQDLGYPGYEGQLNRHCVTIAEALSLAGYDTEMVGKWHLSHLTVSPAHPPAKDKPILNHEVEAVVSPDTSSWPVHRGFREMWGTIVGISSYYDPWSFVHNESSARLPEGSYYTDFITDKSVEVIDRAAKSGGEKPLFLYVAYTAPHWPIQAREEEIKKYESVYSKGWGQLRRERYERLVKLGIIRPEWELAPRETDQPRRDPVIDWGQSMHQAWEVRRMATYAAMIDSLDQGVGKILRKLDETRLAENTLVIFMSDNGACSENIQANWYDVPSKTRAGVALHVGNENKSVWAGPEETFMSYGPLWANVSNTPFRSFKHFVYEGGISAPFIARWPARIHREGKLDTHVGHVIDILPTCLDAAGAGYPGTFDGRDVLPEEGSTLLPTLETGADMPERDLFWEHEGNRAVRRGEWKLVAYNKEPWQLFNLSADRTEQHDLAGEQPGRVKEMAGLYEQWAARCNVRAWPVRPNPAATRPLSLKKDDD